MSERTASCPNCGAEITFRWSGAIQTTCPACRSILVRHDIDLQKVGKVSDVPAAVSGIQLGTEGSFKKKSFVVVGRIIYKHDVGHWNEWYLRFGDGSDAWLSDAQAEYAVTRAVHQAVPDNLRVGSDVALQNKLFKVMSVTRAHYGGVEGELPFEYWDKTEVEFFDLRGEGDRFATIDQSETPALVFIGEFEDFSELRFRNLREDIPTGATPKTRSLSCAACGAAIELRSGELAKTVACSACGTVMDARDDTLRILQQHAQQVQRIIPQIPLGRVGHFKGKDWTVLGYQRRRITVEGEDYEWREYLLWNAEAGFRFLTEYDGHWNDVTILKGLPREIGTASHPQVEYLGTRFKHFQRAKVTTRVVLGEFPWEVRVGDEVWNDDYVAAPLMLSRETTKDEITWSLGTYTSKETIRDAFKLDSVPLTHGVFANQPNPSAKGRGIGKVFLAFMAALFLMFVLRQITASRQQAFQGRFTFNPRTGDTSAFVTPVFDVRGHSSNVEIRIETDLDNDNAFFHLALIPENGGKAYEAGREVSYYWGVDSDGKWTEGTKRDRAFIPSVAPGRYYLRIEPEHEGLKPVNYSVSLHRDVPRAWPFLAALLVLAVPPVFTLGSHHSFESRRWAESDYAPEEEEEE